jgi:NADH-quinone oxidoreductase subunit J
MVLFLFVVMLMNLNETSSPVKNKWLRFAGVISGGSLLLVIVGALKDTENMQKELLMNTGNIGLIHNLGTVLFKNYVLPFEISSVLFLSAMVGAVVIGKK